MNDTHPTTIIKKANDWFINPNGLRDYEKVLKSREDAAKPNLEFFVLLIIATIIATVGLIDNSAAAVIGAMIIAPLMNPIVSLAFAVAINNKKLAKQSITLITIGCLLVILTSGIIYEALDINFIDSQILNRTSPNLIDLSVAIAAGVVGAFAQSRSRLVGSLAGVAVAVALVPPLCVTGIGLKLSAQASLQFNNVIIPSLSHQIPEGAFLLFLTNLIGITAAGMFVFLLQRYGTLKKCWKFALICLALTAILCAPLSKSLEEFRISKNIEEAFKDYRFRELKSASKDTKQSDIWKYIRIMHCNTQIDGDTIKLDLVMQAPDTEKTHPILKAAFQALSDRVEAQSDYKLESTISVVSNHVYKFDPNYQKEI